MSDPVSNWMHANLPPEQWTRETYLELAFMGHVPELDGESESMLPEEFQKSNLVELPKPKKGDRHQI